MGAISTLVGSVVPFLGAILLGKSHGGSVATNCSEEVRVMIHYLTSGAEYAETQIDAVREELVQHMQAASEDISDELSQEAAEVVISVIREADILTVACLLS